MTCNCESAGYCETFKRQMSQRNHQICRNEVLTQEKCEIYRQHWAAMASGNLVQASGPTVQSSGPGTELKSLLELLGAKKTAGCGCDEMIGRMNAWGPSGCREHRAEIVEHLGTAYSDLSMGELATATAGAITSGLALRLNPLDVCGSLVDEAIRRAELQSL